MVVGAPLTSAVSEPFSIAFDAKGVLYGVEFTQSNRVYRLIDGKLEFIAGVPHKADEKNLAEDVNDGADPLKAVFKGMHDIQITRDGKALIGDSFHNRVRMLDLTTGHVSTLAGTGEAGFSGDGGPATAANFSITMTATLTPDQKRILIADIGNGRTRAVDLDSGRVTTVAGNGKKGLPTDGADALQSAMGDTRAVTMAKDGTLYVLLRGGHSLVEVKNGKARTVVNAAGKKGYGGDGGPAREAMMNGPKYVAMDAAGNVLICDTENHCVRRYLPATGTIELVAGHPTVAGTMIGSSWAATELRRPHGVRIGPDGLLYVCDTYNNRVLRGDYK
ncbi:MAG: repeat containing protein [Verrucomicrobiaceae bacterium]|nr:repeat containing protein [Verrucomicrobiaceae bacterium]